MRRGGASLAEADLLSLLAAARTRIREEVSARHRRVSGQVTELRGLSEREILACGDVLSNIVTDVGALIDETEAQVRRSGERAEALTGAFMDAIAAEARTQAQAVESVFSLADGIERAVNAIDDLTASTGVLAINAHIEAAHLGDQGRAFGIIAQQLRELSQSIESTTGQVKAAIADVREGLPPIADRATAMQAHTGRYIERMQEHLRATGPEAGEGCRLDRLVQLSNRALSHLQFQDPLVQRLLGIEREVAELLERIDPLLDGEIEAVTAGEDRDTRAGAPASGDIMLF